MPVPSSATTGSSRCRLGNSLPLVTTVASLVVGIDHGSADLPRGRRQRLDAARIQRESYVWFGTGAAAKSVPAALNEPAVTIAISKKPGTNAIGVARR